MADKEPKLLQEVEDKNYTPKKTGIKAFIEEGTKRMGKSYSDEKADKIINYYNGDYNKILDDVAKNTGVKNVDKFKKKAIDYYQLQMPSEEDIAEHEYLNTPIQASQDDNGYKNYTDLQSHLEVLNGLHSKYNPQQTINPAEMETSKSDVTNIQGVDPSLMQEGWELHPELQEQDERNRELENKKSKINDAIAQTHDAIAQQADYNKSQFGFISEEHEAINKQFKETEAKLDEAIKQQYDNASVNNQLGTLSTKPGFENKPFNFRSADKEKVQNLKHIKDLYGQMNTILASPQSEDFGSQIDGVLHGVSNNVFTRDFISMGINEMFRNVKVKQIFDQYQQYKQEGKTDEEIKQLLPNEQNKLLDTYKLFLNIQAGNRANIGTSLGGGLKDMLPFIAQFAATGGTSAAAKEVVAKFIESKTKNATLGKIAGAIAKPMVQAAMMAPANAQKFGEYIAPTLDQNGNLVKGMDTGEALLKTYLTNISEVVGEDATDFTQKWANKSARANYMKMIANNPTKAQQFLGKTRLFLTQETGVPMVQGLGFEGLGEEITGILEAGIDQDDSFFSADSQKQLWLLSAMASGGFAATSIPNRIAVKSQYKSSAKKLDELLIPEYKEGVKAISENYEDPEEMSTALNDLSKQFDLTPREKAIAGNYIFGSIAYNQMSATRSINIQQNIADKIDKNGNITTGTVNGKQVTVRNPENINQPGKVVFVKDESGKVTPVISSNISNVQSTSAQDITDQTLSAEDEQDEQIEQAQQIQEDAENKGLIPGKTVETPHGKKTLQSVNEDGTATVTGNNGEEINVNIDEIEPYKTKEQKEQEKAQAEQQAALLEGISDPNAEIVSDEPLTDGSETRIVDFSNGQSKLITPEGEQVFNSQEERDNAIAEMAQAEMGAQNDQGAEESEEQQQPEDEDLDNMPPEQAYKKMLEDDPDNADIAEEIFSEHIENKRKQAEETRKQAKETESVKEKQSLLKQAKQLETEAQRLDAILKDPTLLNQQAESSTEGKEDVNDTNFATNETEQEQEPTPEEQAESLYNEYNQEKEISPANILEPWQQYLLGTKVDPESYKRWSDKNNIGMSLARTWFSKKGEVNSAKTIDATAEDLSSQTGQQVTPQDIVDFINDHPNGKVDNKTDRMHEIEQEYQELTGQSIDKHEPEERESTPELADIEDNPLGQTVENVPFRAEEEDNNIHITDKAKEDVKQRKNAIKAINKLHEKHGVPVEIIHSSEMPENVTLQARLLGVKPKGYFYDGKAYIISDSISSVSDVKKTYLHESVLHKGLDILFKNGPINLLGTEFNSKNELLDEVYNRLDGQTVQDRAQYYLRPGETINDLSIDRKREIAEEALATVSERSSSRLRELLDKLWTWLKKQYGFTSGQFSKQDLIKLLQEHKDLLVKNNDAGTILGEDNTSHSMDDALFRIEPSEPTEKTKFITPVNLNILQERLDKHKGSSWANSVKHSISIQDDLSNAIEGNTPKYIQGKLAELIAKHGEEGIWMYYEQSGLIGNAAKPINNISTSLLNCDPSENCAKYCYACKGNYTYTHPSIKSEVIEWGLNKDPKRLAEIAARQYKATQSYMLNKALRLEDKGDINENTIPFVKELNNQGIRTHIYSKRPELLSQIPENNIRLLSIDESNQNKAEKNNLPIAYVYNGSDEDLKFIEDNKDRIQVILPVKIGKKVLDKNHVDKLPKWSKSNQCPIDNGSKDLKNWNCTKCDTGKGIGCYKGQTTESIDFEKEKDYLHIVNKIKYDIDNLPEEYRRLLLESIGKITEEVSESNQSGTIGEVERNDRQSEKLSGKHNESEIDIDQSESSEDLKFRVQDNTLSFKENIPSKIEEQRENVNTDPSEAQLSAGNYQKGHIKFDGFDISIENPKGSIREGRSKDGEKWSNIMPGDYGYFKGTVGHDKDHVDCFLGNNLESDKVYVVDQINPETGKFDEHKVMMGYNSISEARTAYNEAYDANWKGLGTITRTTKQGLKDWFENGDQDKPFANESDVRFRVSSSNPKIQAMLDKLQEVEKTSKFATEIAQLKKDKEKAMGPEIHYINEQIKTLRHGAAIGIDAKKAQVKEIQNNIIDYIEKNMPLEEATAFELKSLIRLVKNSTTPASIEKAFKRVDGLVVKGNKRLDDKASKAERLQKQINAKQEREERLKHVTRVNRLIKWMGGFKKSGMTKKGKFNYEDTKEFQELKALDKRISDLAKIKNSANITQDNPIYSKAMDDINEEYNKILNKEDKTDLDETMLKLIDLRIRGSYASSELAKIVADELEQIYQAAKKAKTEADMVTATNIRTNKEFVKKFLAEDINMENKSWFKKAMTQINSRTANMMGNWETILTMIGGTELRDKYSLMLNEADMEVGKKQTFDSLLDHAKIIYGKDSKVGTLNAIHALSEKKYKLRRSNKVIIDAAVQGINQTGSLSADNNKSLLPMKLSKLELMDIYNAIKNDKIANDYYMQYGDPVTDPNIDPETARNMQYDDGMARINGLVNNLEPKDKVFADAMFNLVNEYYDKINPVFIKLNNRDLPRNKNYWPSTVEREQDVDVQDRFMGDYRNPGSTKERDVRRTPLPMDAFNKFTKHINESEWMINMALPIKDINKTFKSIGIKRMIEDKRGTTFYKNIEDIIQNTGLMPLKSPTTEVDKLLNPVLNNWVAGKIGGTISVPLKQLLSAANYSENMPTAQWAKGFVHTLFNAKNAWKEMMQIPYLKARLGNGYSETVQRALDSDENIHRSKAANYHTAFKNLMTIGTRYGDITAIILGGKPYLDYLIKEKGLSQKEAVDKFLQDTLRSQQAPFKSTLSKYQNSSSVVARALFTFANTPSQYMRKLFEANQNYRVQKQMFNAGKISEEEFKQAKHQTRKAHQIYALMNAITFSLTGALINCLLKGIDPDKDQIMKDVADNLGNSYIGGLPYVKDVVGLIRKKAIGVKQYDEADPFMEGINQIVNPKSTHDWFTGLSTLYGIPLHNLEKNFSAFSSEKREDNRAKQANDKLTQLKKSDNNSLSAAATKLKSSYSKAKSKATKLRKEGKIAKAEMIEDLIKDSKLNIQNTKYSSTDLEIENKMFDRMIERIK